MTRFHRVLLLAVAHSFGAALLLATLVSINARVRR